MFVHMTNKQNKQRFGGLEIQTRVVLLKNTTLNALNMEFNLSVVMLKVSRHAQ